MSTILKAWTRPALAVLLISACGVTSAAEQTFREWANAWRSGAERGGAVKHWESVAADPAQGTAAVVRSLQDQIQAIATSGDEAKWQTTMVCHMELSYLGALDHTRPAQALTDKTKQAINDKRAEFATLGTARFKPTLPINDAFFRIFTGMTHHCGEIKIDASWTGVAAREIYKAADLLGQLQDDAAIPALESMARTVAESRARWNLFFENVIYDGFPWELYANELAQSFVPKLRGTLAQPPTAQLRVLHPTPLMTVSTRGETTFKANFGIEALGWRVYDPDKYVPRWGASALVSLRESKSDSTGYGLLATFRGWSIGAIQRDTAERNNEIQIVVGVDVAEWIQKKRVEGGALSQVLERLNDELEGGWNEAEAVESSAKNAQP